jgi:hypothetical protein
MLPPGLARLAAKPWPTGSETPMKTMGISPVSRRICIKAAVPPTKITSDALLNQLSCQRCGLTSFGGAETIVDPKVATFDPA